MNGLTGAAGAEAVEDLGGLEELVFYREGDEAVLASPGGDGIQGTCDGPGAALEESRPCCWGVRDGRDGGGRQWWRVVGRHFERQLQEDGK